MDVVRRPIRFEDAMKRTAALVVLSLGLLIAGRGLALTIDDSTTELNDRFTNDPTFIMNNYDLSGVGRTGAGRWGTLVSRNVFISANHFHPNAGDTLRFYQTNDPNGATARMEVAGGQRIGNSDIWIGVLTEPVPVGYAVYDFATTDITTTNQFNNSVYDETNAFLFGQSPFNNFVGTQDVAVGRNELDLWLNNAEAESTTDDALLSSIENEAQDVMFESELVVGDSGAPLFVDFNENDNDYTLQLVGTNWFIGTVSPGNTDVNGFTYLGNYDAQIQAFIDSNPFTILGDLNGDGELNFSDIDAFVMALVDLDGYTQTYPGLDPDVLGDFNGSGTLTNADIYGFIEALNAGGFLTAEQAALLAEAGGISNVPEPTSLALLAPGGLLLLRRRQRG